MTLIARDPSAASRRSPRPALMALALGLCATLALTGCGYLRVPLHSTPAGPDFTIAVSPSTATVTAGGSTPALSFTLTRLNGFTGSVTVTGAGPAGATCLPAACTVAIPGSTAANALQFSIPASALPGTETLTFTAASGSLQHVVTATITVVAASGSGGSSSGNPPVVPPGTPPIPVPSVAADQACAVPNPVTAPGYAATGFVPTGDPGPTGIAYDALHNQIFVTNFQLNEIDIVSPESMAISRRLPMPLPWGLDISADGQTLIVGTQSHYFYQVSTTTLCVTDREYFPIEPPVNYNLSPADPVAMADGSIVFGAFDPLSTETGFYRWSAQTGFTQPPGQGSLALSVGRVLPSGDRQHAILSGDDSGGYYGRFDLSTGAVVASEVAFGSQPFVLAVNQDATRVLLVNDCCGLEVTDGDFKPLAQYKVQYLGSAFAEPDFSKIYVQQDFTKTAEVFDSSLNPIGSIALPFSPISAFQTNLSARDGSHRLLSATAQGLALTSTAQLNPSRAADAAYPSIRFGVGDNAAMLPATTQNGFFTILNGGGFTANPSVRFAERTLSEPVPSASTTSENTIPMIATNFADGCADVQVLFPDGAFLVAPQAFCYAPVIDAVDGDAGPTTGGGTLTLFGRGFGSTTPTVTVGGVAATNVAISREYGQGIPFEMGSVTATVPPGPIGTADISISTSFGSTTLPTRYTYVQRQDTPLPSGAQPSQLLLDAPRSRILVTDSAHNQLLVYALGSGSLLQSVPTGPQPQGLALSPDGSKLLLATAGDYVVSVLDADSYAPLQHAVLPSSATTYLFTAPSGPPVQVIALVGNRAMVKTQAGYLQGSANPYSNPHVFDYDLNANTLTLHTLSLATQFGSDFAIAASADGNWAVLANQLYQVATGALLTDDTENLPFTDVTLASDGTTTVNGAGEVYDQSLHLQTQLSAPQQVAGLGLFEGFFPGIQLNATGSLLYRPTADHVRIYDVQHGILLRTVEVPGGIVGSLAYPLDLSRHLLAVHPAGQQFILVTAAGLSIFTTAQDPLTLRQATLQAGQLNLFGSGFTAQATLKVDQLEVPCTVASSTQLTASLPALNPGAHSVTVTNPDGSADTLTLAFVTN